MAFFHTLSLHPLTLKLGQSLWRLLPRVFITGDKLTRRRRSQQACSQTHVVSGKGWPCVHRAAGKGWPRHTNEASCHLVSTYLKALHSELAPWQFQSNSGHQSPKRDRGNMKKLRVGLHHGLQLSGPNSKCGQQPATYSYFSSTRGIQGVFQWHLISNLARVKFPLKRNILFLDWLSTFTLSRVPFLTFCIDGGKTNIQSKAYCIENHKLFRAGS